MTIWHMRIAYWIPKATNIHSEYVILMLFHCIGGCTNAPRGDFILTLRVLLNLAYEANDR
jgi:hypothetical protein